MGKKQVDFEVEVKTTKGSRKDHFDLTASWKAAGNKDNDWGHEGHQTWRNLSSAQLVMVGNAFKNAVEATGVPFTKPKEKDINNVTWRHDNITVDDQNKVIRACMRVIEGLGDQG